VSTFHGTTVFKKKKKIMGPLLGNTELPPKLIEQVFNRNDEKWPHREHFGLGSCGSSDWNKYSPKHCSSKVKETETSLKRELIEENLGEGSQTK